MVNPNWAIKLYGKQEIWSFESLILFNKIFVSTRLLWGLEFFQNPFYFSSLWFFLLWTTRLPQSLYLYQRFFDPPFKRVQNISELFRAIFIHFCNRKILENLFYFRFFFFCIFGYERSIKKFCDCNYSNERIVSIFSKVRLASFLRQGFLESGLPQMLCLCKPLVKFQLPTHSFSSHVHVVCEFVILF